MIKHKEYCTECGYPLTREQTGAEEIVATSWGGNTYHPYTKYDGKTGLRNYAYRYSCSNPKQRWFESHVDYVRKD